VLNIGSGGRVLAVRCGGVYGMLVYRVKSTSGLGRIFTTHLALFTQ